MLEVGFQQHNNCYMIVICIYILVYGFSKSRAFPDPRGSPWEHWWAVDWSALWSHLRDLTVNMDCCDWKVFTGSSVYIAAIPLTGFLLVYKTSKTHIQKRNTTQIVVVWTQHINYTTCILGCKVAHNAWLISRTVIDTEWEGRFILLNTRPSRRPAPEQKPTPLSLSL